MSSNTMPQLIYRVVTISAYCSAGLETSNLSILQWTASLELGCHLGWHFAVGCPLRGGRGEYTVCVQCLARAKSLALLTFGANIKYLK